MTKGMVTITIVVLKAFIREARISWLRSAVLMLVHRVCYSNYPFNY